MLYAAGTFNWRVKVGDTTRLTEFGKPARRLTRETSDTEIVWTLSTTAVPRSQVALWTSPARAGEAARASPGTRAGSTDDLAFCRKSAKVYAILLAILNVPVALVTDRG
ncbi:hypothetical protein ACU4GD_29530 [Cupriavidus basilensis]